MPTAPDGVEFNYGSAEFIRYEDLGLAEAGKCAFVLVAGGLGERLGYSHIKVSLPCSAIRDVSFLQFYAESLLALQVRSLLPALLRLIRGCKGILYLTNDPG